MVFLILFALLALAALYGIFFLVFKLLWLLFKSKRNLWPLVLAGVATVGLVLALAWAVWHTARTFIRPVAPITAAVKAGGPLQHGTRIYHDPKFGFELDLQEGMTMGNWLEWNGIVALPGFDVNTLKEKNAATGNKAFSLIGILYQTLPQPLQAQALAQEIANAVEGYADPRARLELTEPIRPVIPPSADEETSGAVLKGQMTTANRGESIPLTLLVVTRGREAFYVLGAGENDEGRAEQTALSFRFPKN